MSFYCQAVTREVTREVSTEVSTEVSDRRPPESAGQPGRLREDRERMSGSWPSLATSLTSSEHRDQLTLTGVTSYLPAGGPSLEHHQIPLDRLPDAPPALHLVSQRQDGSCSPQPSLSVDLLLK